MGGRRATGSGGTGVAAKACTASQALALGGSSRAVGAGTPSLGVGGLLRSGFPWSCEGASGGAFGASGGFQGVAARAGGEAWGGGRQKALSDVLAGRV